MKIKAVSGVMLTLLLTGMLTLAFNIQPVKASGTIYIKADGSVDPPTANIASVDNITYTFTANIYEEIVVERSNIIVDGNGYTLESVSKTPLFVGFDLYGINNVSIQNTNIKNFRYGVRLDSSSNNTVSGNNITNNGDGIYLENSSNNTISGNNITSNVQGIELYESSNNTLRNNNANNNEYNFDVYGSLLSHYIQDIDDSNTVNNKPIYYWINTRDMTVPLDAGYVALVNCTGMKVQNLNLTNNGQGVLLAFTTNSTITNNNITENGWYGIELSDSSNNTVSGNNITNNTILGIGLSDSSNNTVSGNNITNNGDGIGLSDSSNNTVSGNSITNNGYGIYLYNSSNTAISENNITNNWDGIYLYSSSNTAISGNNITNNGDGIGLSDSSNNTIYHNNFINNTQQVYCLKSTNAWDDGGEGNHWSDYEERYPNATEIDNSGVWDTPYEIDENNTDNYPLVNPYYEKKLVGGLWVPVDKFALLAPYIALASAILVATAATAIYVKQIKRRKEKQ